MTPSFLLKGEPVEEYQKNICNKNLEIIFRENSPYLDLVLQFEWFYET